MKVVVSCLLAMLCVFADASSSVDINQDGMIDRNEFHWAFPDSDLYHEFAKVDTDNSGLITVEEIEEFGRLVDTNEDQGVESRRKKCSFKCRILFVGAMVSCGGPWPKCLIKRLGRKHGKCIICQHH